MAKVWAGGTTPTLPWLHVPMTVTVSLDWDAPDPLATCPNCCRCLCLCPFSLFGCDVPAAVTETCLMQ